MMRASARLCKYISSTTCRGDELFEDAFIGTLCGRLAQYGGLRCDDILQHGVSVYGI
jgi:hypothetical protein